MAIEADKEATFYDSKTRRAHFCLSLSFRGKARQRSPLLRQSAALARYYRSRAPESELSQSVRLCV